MTDDDYRLMVQRQFEGLRYQVDQEHHFLEEKFDASYDVVKTVTKNIDTLLKRTEITVRYQHMLLGIVLFVPVALTVVLAFLQLRDKVW